MTEGRSRTLLKQAGGVIICAMRPPAEAGGKQARAEAGEDRL